MPRRRFPSLGRCIYCLRRFPPEDLTEEHIVPEGLNGSLMFEKAVCGTCRTKTSQTYENKALNKELYVPRRILELRKQKRKKKPWRPLPAAMSGEHAVGGGGGKAALRRYLAQRQAAAFGDDGKDAQGAVERLHRGGLGRTVEGARATTLAFFAGFHGDILVEFVKLAMKKFFTLREVEFLENGKRNEISS